MGYYEQVKEAADAIRARVPAIPEIGIVLGSGLGDFAGSLGDAVTMPYGDLPHWPASRVIGHDGKLVVGRSGGRTIAALAGRSHAGRSPRSPAALTPTKGTTWGPSPLRSVRWRCSASGR
jgi:purine-nucleoside phosphorylase